MVGSIHNWAAYFKQAYKHIKPGGYVEAQEMSVDIMTDDKSFPEHSYIKEWCDLLESGVLNTGYSIRLTPDELRHWIEDAGFVDVTVKSYKLPIGLWPADEKLREVGKAQLLATLEGVHGLTLALWTRALNRSVEELEVFLAKLRAEFKQRSVHSYWPL